MSAPGVFLPEFRPRTPRSRSTLSTLVLLAVTTTGLGTATTLAVAASPACSKLVHTYIERLERNVVSQATLKRWHDWGVGHPNWRPSLHAHRPKFKKVRREVVSSEPISCPAFIPPVPAETALLTPDLDTFVLPPEAPAFNQAFFAPPLAPVGNGPYFPGLPIGGIFGPGGGAPSSPISGPVSTPISVPVSGTVAQPPISGLPIPNPGLPGTPVTLAPVPEPDNIVLILAAMLGFALFQRGSTARNPAPRPLTPQRSDPAA